MILSCAEMKAAEERAFAAGTSAEELMEIAGRHAALAVRQFFPTPGRCIAFFGKGHNGGDALVAARHLKTWGWAVELSPIATDLAPLTQRMLDQLHAAAGPQSVAPSASTIILDGLLGIGANGPPREGVAAAVTRIRHLRMAGATIFAMDVPSGLNGDSGEPSNPCVEADFTVAMGCFKKGLLADSAANYVGRLCLAPLPGLALKEDKLSRQVAVAADLRQTLPPRRFDTHKGIAGRVGIIAGSRGFLGAARLCAAGAVRAGAGLVTLYATEDHFEQLSSACEPEIMVKPVRSWCEALEDRHNALAIGPGLGLTRRLEVLRVIREARCPMVVDADGLNALPPDVEILKRCSGPRLLTPHPGEMARLAPNLAGFSREETALKFTGRFPITLLLKGSRTVVAEEGAWMSYNSTGHPGMASGGMGDVLTGVCSALLGQGLSLREAAVIGAWVCGRAAEISIFERGESQESVRASRVLENLGPAFTALREGCF